MCLISGYGHSLDGVLHTQHLHTITNIDIFRTKIAIFVQSVFFHKLGTIQTM